MDYRYCAGEKFWAVDLTLGVWTMYTHGLVS